MQVLGISAFYHDSAAALIRDGEIVAASQEERFTRKKNDSSLPLNAIRACLKQGGVSAASPLDLICFYDSPWLKFERILGTFVENAPASRDPFVNVIPVWIRRKLWLTDAIRESLNWQGEIFWCSHHESHAASAFYPSPFESAAIVTMDGVGEWTTASWGVGEANTLTMREEIRFPHSIGLLYSAFTHFLGFKANCDEYKVMGLAPYGRPTHARRILNELVDLKADGSFRLCLDYFDYVTGDGMANDRLEELLGVSKRAPSERLTQAHMDLAASIQVVTEEAVRRICRHAVATTGNRRLCLAGGTALNCVANGKLLRDGICDDLWIQPAAGDAGGALGVALYAYHHHLKHPRRISAGRDLQRGSLLGPSYSTDEIRRFLDLNDCAYEEFATSDDMCERVAQLIDEGKVIGWFQDRMEFGPRALGCRSILADARSPEMQSVLNCKIKARESFRPFAPAVLREDVDRYFELDRDSDYMLLVSSVRPEHHRTLSAAERRVEGTQRVRIPHSDIPAVTHVDYSARIQTVHQDRHATFHSLISAFKRRTGCPLVVNTSLNVRDEPIAESPRDAYRCFQRTEMDVLVLDRFVLEKDRRTPGYLRTELLNDEAVGEFFTIYVVGGSTALGYPYQPDLNLGKLVAARFGGRVNGKPVRVVNLAAMARDAEYCLRRIKEVPPSASLILLYPGHNEFLPKSPAVVGDLRLAWLSEVWDYILMRPVRPYRRAEFSSRVRSRTIDEFESTLTMILHHAQSIGVPIIVSTAASNQRDWPPNSASLQRAINGPFVRKRLRRAQAQMAEDRVAQAAAALTEILEKEPTFAHAHWLLGDCLTRLARHAEAARHFQLAVDYDERPSRASSAENAVIRRVGHAAGVPVVDYEALVTQAAGDGVPGYAWFEDNCHPNLGGMALLAEGFADAMTSQLAMRGDGRPLSSDAIRRRFALDHEREIQRLATRFFYIFNNTFVTGQWNTEPARIEMRHLADRLSSLDRDHRQSVAARAVCLVLAGEVDAFVAAARRALADAAVNPSPLADWLSDKSVQRTLVRYGMARCLDELAIRAPSVLQRARALLDGLAVVKARAALSNAMMRLAFIAVVRPAGRVARLLGTTAIPARIDPWVASYWTTYDPETAVIERSRARPWWRRLGVVGFMFRRRRFTLAFVSLCLFSIGVLLYSTRALLTPLIYTLF